MLALPAHHLLNHAAVVGMTGSGKTGLVFVLVEEASSWSRKPCAPAFLCSWSASRASSAIWALRLDDLVAEIFVPC